MYLFEEKYDSLGGDYLLDSNKKYHSQIAQRFVQLTILSYTVSLSNFFFWKDLTSVTVSKLNFKKKEWKKSLVYT